MLLLAQGKAHMKRARGYAGIVPNAAGYLPYLSPEVIAACNGAPPGARLARPIRISSPQVLAPRAAGIAAVRVWKG